MSRREMAEIDRIFWYMIAIFAVVFGGYVAGRMV